MIVWLKRDFSDFCEDNYLAMRLFLIRENEGCPISLVFFFVESSQHLRREEFSSDGIRFIDISKLL